MENSSALTDKLTINQLRWLANRAWHGTDMACIKALEMGESTVSRWRAEQPHFVEAERTIWTGDIKRTQEIIARTRDEAALTLKGLLTARDKRVQRQTAVDLLKFGGLVQGESVEHGVSSALAELLSKAKEEE